MPENTNYQLYGGRIGELTAQTFGVTFHESFVNLTRFNWRAGIRMSFGFDGYANTGVFDSWKGAIEEFTSVYTVPNLAEYETENDTHLAAVKAAAFSICGLSVNDFELTEIFAHTRQKVLLFNFAHKSLNLTQSFTIDSDYYDLTMAQNLSLGQEIIGLGWAFSDSADGKYSSLQPVPLPIPE